MTTTKSKRGFGSMDTARRREIASQGGKAAHARGVAHEFSADEARFAGRKGGQAVSRDRKHMSEIGRLGGKAHQRKLRETHSNSTLEASAEVELPTEGAGEAPRQ